MTEETQSADVSGPKGIWKSIVISVIFGYILLLAVNYAVPPEGGYLAALSYSSTRSPQTSRRRSSIFQQSLGDNWAIFVLLIVVGAQFFCGMASVTANSRMIYAFSRDGAVPGPQVVAHDQQAHAHTNQRHLARGGRSRGSSSRPRTGTGRSSRTTR